MYIQKRYVAPTNQESLKLQAIIGYNGNGRENLVWYPHTGFFAYTVGCNIIVEDLNTNHQTILTGKSKLVIHSREFNRNIFLRIGHTEEISTMTLSNNATILASAQCSISRNKEELQAKIIIWDTKTLRQKLYFHQSVQAIQSMAFSK